MKENVTKYSLLSVSLLVVSAGAIAGNIPAIAETYPTINGTFVELITTLPSLFVIATVMLSPKLAQKVGYKLTIQIGILIVLLSSLVPVFIDSFWFLFISRMFFGIGVGLFNPLLYSFSSYLYSGEKLAAVIGLQSSFEGIGGMLLTFLVGQLLKINWQTSFSAYFLAFPILILFTNFVPQLRREPIGTNQKEDTSNKKEQLDRSIFGYILLLMLIVTIYMTVTVKITSLFLEKGIGNATDGSNMIAIVGFGAMLAGVIFGRLVTVTKEWTLTISFLGLGIAMWIIAYSNSVMITAIASLLCGFSFRIFIPYLFNQVNQTQKSHSERNTSILLIGFNIGAAFAPISISFIQQLLSLNNQASIFVTEGVIMFVLAIGTIGKPMLFKKK